MPLQLRRGTGRLRSVTTKSVIELVSGVNVPVEARGVMWLAMVVLVQVALESEAWVRCLLIKAISGYKMKLN